VFNIEFTHDKPEIQEEGWLGLSGQTTLGDHVESFLAPIGLWARADYERHWLEAARRLLDGHVRTGFFTSLYQFWWTMWREGERVFVHEELLTRERYGGPTDGTVPYEIIGERISESAGHRVSEWELSLDDIRSYVQRRERSAVPV
jgi:hypothetical protein